MATKASAAKRSPGHPKTPNLSVAQLRRKFQELADPGRAVSSQWFFRTGPGEYGEGDRFLGLTVPQQRQLARKYRQLPFAGIASLLSSKYHEHRLTALLILVGQYQRGDESSKQALFDFYVNHFSAVNNWDLVDSSAPYIVGEHLLSRPREVLRDWVRSSSLWERRIAILATAAFIRRGDLIDTFALSELLLADEHDLIHKAVGWMLREAGKKDEEALRGFLKKHYESLPRTALRYAIERWPEPPRKAALRGQF